MKTKTVTLLLSLIAFAAGLTGCASYRPAERTTATLDSLADRIENNGLQMDIAVTELDNLVNNPQPDLRPQFGRLAAAVGKLQSLGTNVLKADGALQGRSKVHAQIWDQELALIQNDVIRANGQARKLEVLSQFDGVRNLCQETRTAVAPVQSDLMDIEHFLHSDLTAGGLTTIKDAAARVARNAAPARESITKLVAQLRGLGNAVAPQAGVTANATPAK